MDIAIKLSGILILGFFAYFVFKVIEAYRQSKLVEVGKTCKYCGSALLPAKYFNGKRWVPYCIICPQKHSAEFVTIEYEKDRLVWEKLDNGGEPMEIDDDDIYWLEEDGTKIV